MTTRSIGMLGRFTSAGQIARFFAMRGIKGTPGVANDCPIANYVRPFYPQAKQIQVGYGCGVLVFYSTKEMRTGRWQDGSRGLVNNPDRYESVMENTPAMYEFLRLFDAGLCPELIG